MTGVTSDMSGMPRMPNAQGQNRPTQPPAPVNASAPAPPKQVVRRKANDNPFARRKARPKAPTVKSPPNYAATNGGTSKREQSQPETLFAARAFSPALQKVLEKRRQNNGWSETPISQVAEFPLFASKKDLLDGIRYHVMRFNANEDKMKRRREGAAKKVKSEDGSPDAEKVFDEIDPTNEDQFPRPVSLHRRDPRLPPGGKVVLKDEPPSADSAEDAAAAAEAERKKAEKEALASQIAPSIKGKGKHVQQKTEKDRKAQGYYGRESVEQKKQAGLRYEETLPWHLESVDGKNVWVGSYVASLSEMNVALVIEGSGFRMIPLERHYKFDEKPRFNTMSLDEAEKLMKDTAKPVGRWLMADREEMQAKLALQDYRSSTRGKMVNTDVGKAADRNRDYEMDFEGMEFDDDDEAPGFDADDEATKESKNRQRREQLGANLFGEGDEDEVEKEQENDQKQKLQRKVLGKQTVKSLTKHEHALDYAGHSDSDDDNPFADSSDSDSDTDTEKKDEAKEEDAKKDPSSGNTSKGTSTSSGSKKGPDNAKKCKPLKRPGSPNLSDSSGNESSRKKVKVGVMGHSSLANSRASTPSLGRPKGLAGALSDSEATAGEGSDSGFKPQKMGTKAVSPGGSRATSPNPSANPVSPVKASGFQGPGPSSGAASPQTDGAVVQNRVQPQEIVEVLQKHPEGMTIGNLLRCFTRRVDQPGTMTKQEWITLVKQVADWSKMDRLLRVKPVH